MSKSTRPARSNDSIKFLDVRNLLFMDDKANLTSLRIWKPNKTILKTIIVWKFLIFFSFFLTKPTSYAIRLLLTLTAP